MATTTTPMATKNKPEDDDPHPRIAIIGGGAAGLASARAFLKQQQNYEIVVFEKDKSEIAGVWNYQDNDHHPMYQNLRTNLPKEIMAFPEYPFSDDEKYGNNASFLHHKQVKEYLHDYATAFDLYKYIRFGCTVQQLTVLCTDTQQQQPSLLSPSASTTSKSDEKEDREEIWPKIRLEWTSSQNDSNDDDDDDDDDGTPQQQNSSDVFDAVLICNGHYSVPQIPDLPGVSALLHDDQSRQHPEHPPNGNSSMKIMHSIGYNRPEPFADQNVLCVGGRASGSDLAREIAKYAKHVYLSDTTFPKGRHNFITQDNITWVPKTVGIDAHARRVSLEDFGSTNCTVEDQQQPVQQQQQQQQQQHLEGVDTIIFCSGYNYDFPFINQQSNLELETWGRRVRPLYEQLWHAGYPNVAFVGLPHSVVPFPLFEFQAQAVERSWRREPSSSRVLPDFSQRQVLAEQAATSGGEGKPNGRVPDDTHYLGSAQWDYCRRMAKYADVYDDNVEDYLVTNEMIYDDASSQRKGEFPAGPDHYRSLCYKREKRSFQVSSPTMTAATNTADDER